MHRKMVEYSRLCLRSNLTEEEQTRRDELRREIAAFIDGIDEPYINRLFIARYLDGMEWVEVAQIAGGRNTHESVRMICKRYVQKKGKTNGL